MPKAKKIKRFICPMAGTVIETVKGLLIEIDTAAGSIEGNENHCDVDSEASRIQEIVAHIRTNLKIGD